MAEESEKWWVLVNVTKHRISYKAGNARILRIVVTICTT